MHSYSGTHATVRVSEGTNEGLGYVFGEQHQSASKELCLGGTKTNNYITLNNRLTIRDHVFALFMQSRAYRQEEEWCTVSNLLLLSCVVFLCRRKYHRMSVLCGSHCQLC